MKQRHILVVLLHGIGDCLMAFPALHALKQQTPKPKITVMTIDKPLYHDLFKHNEDVDATVSSSLSTNPHYGNPLLFLREYRAIQQDIRRAQQQQAFTDVYFVKMFVTPAKLYSFIPLKRYREHKTTKIARELNITLKRQRYHFAYGQKDKQWAQAYLKQHKLNPKKLICLHFTGSAPSKSLSYTLGRQLVKDLKAKGYDLLLFHDKYSYAREVQHYDAKDVVTYVSDSLLRTAALVDQAQALICVDSGIAHLAAALGKKTFVIYFKNIWRLNSLALGNQVQPYVYQQQGKTLLKEIRLFFQ